jgi:hypothetical protein
MALLLSISALILTIAMLFPVAKIFHRWNTSSQEEKSQLEKVFYLAFAAVAIILGIRLFLVPLHFWTMQSFVHMIPGAMCLWGVFDAVPGFAWGGLLLKFVLPIVYIGWLLLAYINNKCRTHPLMQNLMAFFIITAPLVLIDSAVDIFTFSEISPVQVNCCTSAIDVGNRPIPVLIGGVSGQLLLAAGFFAVAAAFAASLFLALKYRFAHWISLVLSIPLAALLVVTITEVFTPWILRLPFHHCPFCLFFQHPLSIIYASLLWFALASPWLILIISKLGRENEESKNYEAKLKRTILTYSIIAVLVSLCIIAADILVAFL